MQPFKVQALKLPNSPPPQPPAPPLPPLSVLIPSITCLNYPIETLVQVLDMHFAEEPCAANYVAKALKIISISLKDGELRGKVEAILAANVHSRARVYALVEYWVGAVGEVGPVLAKLDTRVVEGLIGAVMAEYCLTVGRPNPMIVRLLVQYMEAATTDSMARIAQTIKNQFAGMLYPFYQFMHCLKRINVSDNRNKNLLNFLSGLAGEFLKSQRCQHALQNKLQAYFTDQQVQHLVDEFFTVFSSLQGEFIANIRSKLNAGNVLGVWMGLGAYGMDGALRMVVKEWVNSKENYWRLFEAKYQAAKMEKSVDVMYKLIELGSEMDNQTLFQSFITKESIYHFLLSRPLDPVHQVTQARLLLSEPYKKVKPMAELIAQHSRNYEQIVSAPGISILVINTIQAPAYWKKTDMKMLGEVQLQVLKPWVQRLKVLFDSANQKYLDKYKKLELAFHCITVEVQDGQERYQIAVSLRQLASMMKQKQFPKGISIHAEYQPYESEVKLQVQKQAIGAVIEARIVRVMKRANKRMNSAEIFAQLQDMNVSLQNCRLALKKVVSRGFVNEESEDLYIYCP